MWLIEKSPDTNKYFLPVNAKKVTYIKITDEKRPNTTNRFGIKFIFKDIDHWVQWWFQDEEIRDKYFSAVMKKLPKINLEIGSLSLQIYKIKYIICH